MSIVNFKAVVIGMGVQGNKRASVANKDLLATVDIDKNKADIGTSNGKITTLENWKDT